MPSESQHHEPSDLSRKALRGAGIIVGLTIGAGLATAWLALWLGGPLPPGPGLSPEAGAPVLRPDLGALRGEIAADWAARARSDAPLPDDPGYLRIPVQRAAELLLARGFPARPGGERGAP